MPVSLICTSRRVQEPNCKQKGPLNAPDHAAVRTTAHILITACLEIYCSALLDERRVYTAPNNAYTKNSLTYIVASCRTGLTFEGMTGSVLLQSHCSWMDTRWWFYKPFDLDELVLIRMFWTHMGLFYAREELYLEPITPSLPWWFAARLAPAALAESDGSVAACLNTPPL